MAAFWGSVNCIAAKVTFLKGNGHENSSNVTQNGFTRLQSISNIQGQDGSQTTLLIGLICNTTFVL